MGVAQSGQPLDVGSGNYSLCKLGASLSAGGVGFF